MAGFWQKLTTAFDEEDRDPIATSPYDPSTAYHTPVPMEPHPSGQSYPAAQDDSITTPPTEEVGELSVDLYETDDSLILKAVVAGVSLDDLDIAVSRDSVTVTGIRPQPEEASSAHIHLSEVFWGKFTRTLTLPAEIDIEEARAMLKDGVLTLDLPKVDKHRQRKLKPKVH